MALASWPEWMPQWPLIDFDSVPRGGLSSTGEALYVVQNRAFPEQDASFKFLVTLEQKERFREWYRTALNGGCAPFACPWAETVGLPGYYARCTEPYESKHLGLENWQLTLHLELIAPGGIVRGGA
ncbi:hypothetical protein [Megalodesulfovibrio paquesii]